MSAHSHSITAEMRSTLPAAVHGVSSSSSLGAAASIEQQQQPLEEIPYQLSEDPIHDPSGTSVSRHSMQEQLKIYLASHLATELAGTVALGTFVFFIRYAFGRKPTLRPIPYQSLDNDNNANYYVRNLVNNEEVVDTSTVSTLLLSILCVVMCPFLQLLLSYSRWGRVRDVHTTLCVYWWALPVNELVTWSIKLYVGYLRPNFYDQCQPSDDYSYCTAADENGNAYDLRMSFPSGHASWAFCALTLLTFYLERIFGVSSIEYYQNIDNNNNNGESTCMVLQHRQNPFVYRLRSVLCLAPLILAIFVATSRIVDNQHFPADILAGSVLGYSVAAFFHPLWYVHYRTI